MAAAILRTLRMDVEATKSSSRDSSPNSVLRPESTWKEDAKSVATWFYNLVGPTLKGRPAYKPTMPDVVPFIIEQLKDVMGPLNGKSDWTFCDLGCSQGMMLADERCNDGWQAHVWGVVGVELDPGTHRKRCPTQEPRIEVVCGDMFPFIKDACNGELFGGRATFMSMSRCGWPTSPPRRWIGCTATCSPRLPCILGQSSSTGTSALLKLANSSSPHETPLEAPIGSSCL